MAKTPGTEDDDKVAESPEDTTVEGLKRSDDDVETASELDEIVEVETSKDTVAAPIADSVTEEEEATDSMQELADEPALEVDVDEPAPEIAVDEPAPEVDTTKESPPEQPAPPVAAPPVRRRGLSVVLGGVIAALIGAGALYYASMEDWVSLGGPDEELLARLASLESSLSAAETEIATLKGAEPDLSGVTSAIETAVSTAEAASAANAEAVAALTTRLNSTEERLQAVAVQQIPEAELPKAISDAYDARLTDLRATIDGRFTTMQAELNAKLAELEQTQAASAEAEAAALEAARLARVRAALAALQTSLDTGAAYADQLATVAELSTTDIPASLTDPAESGIPSMSDLAEAFPDAARDALTVSAAAAVEEGSLSRIEAFLRTQAGARSLTPRDGDDPDAVLSRAEAALALGDLDTTLAEIAALPDVGQEAMAGWVARAQTRKAALAAAEELASQLEQN